jgi:hypothetical protein
MKIDYRGDFGVLGLWWIRTHEGQQDNNGADTDLLNLVLNYKTGNHRFAPFIMYQKTNDATDQPSATTTTTTDSNGDTTTTTSTSYGRRDRLGLTAGEPLDIYVLGLRWDGKFGNWDIYAFGAYQTGDHDNVDLSAYAGEVKASVKLGQWGAWGRFMYASGDDDVTDNDIEGWYTPGMRQGSVSDWSQLWGHGAFDRNAPDGAHTKEITDLMAFGLGAWYNFSKAWTGKFSWWNINFAEDGPNSQQANGLPRQGSVARGNGTDKSIGNEFDVWFTYNVMKNMKLHMLFAYLVMGDAIEPTTNSQDPWELGAQLEIRW